jgi:hypothetical protein
MPTETEYKRKFREICGCWTEVYEPARGSGTGYPDVQMLVDGVLIPVEMKRGDIKNGFVRPHRIRPSQIAWHHAFGAAGGKSHFLICTGPLRTMSAYSIAPIERTRLVKWRSGWTMDECTPWVLDGSLVLDMSLQNLLK